MADWLNEKWEYLMVDVADQKTKGWFLVDSPFPAIILALVYHRFVRQIGPEFMKNKKPYNLDKIIQIYNLVQVFLCGWLAYEGFRLTYGPNGTYSWKCQPLDESMSPHAIKISSLTWIYYMIKIFDFLDTVFFVLRKKYNQASFLHVYHHIGAVGVGFVGTKYYSDGQGFALIIVNSFVHMFMYMYYFLTNYNPEYRKKIWWKKYITQMQMVQFAFLFVHFTKTLLIPSCKYPIVPTFLFAPQLCFISYLFMKFYKDTYLSPKQQPVKAS